MNDASRNRPRRDVQFVERPGHIEMPRPTLSEREGRDLGQETLGKFAVLGRDPVAERRADIAKALIENATVRVCKRCGGGAAYLETRPGLDYCTPECEALGPSQRRSIASVMDIPLAASSERDEEIAELEACLRRSEERNENLESALRIARERIAALEGKR